jgi:hypothetical protein
MQIFEIVIPPSELDLAGWGMMYVEHGIRSKHQQSVHIQRSRRLEAFYFIFNFFIGFVILILFTWYKVSPESLHRQHS